MIDEWVNRNAEQIDFGDMLSDPKYNSSDLCFCQCIMNIRTDNITYHTSFDFTTFKIFVFSRKG